MLVTALFWDGGLGPWQRREISNQLVCRVAMMG